jgi:predicted alpha-1,6-mannanase (GH76 family)
MTLMMAEVEGHISGIVRMSVAGDKQGCVNHCESVRTIIARLESELQKQTERAEKAKAERDNLIYENKVRDKAIDLLQKGMAPNQGGYLMLEARIALEAQARAELAEHDRSHKPTPEDIRNLTDVLKKDGNDG